MRPEKASRAEVESTIEKARQNLTATIDELDARIRGQLDFEKMASEHAPQLMAAGAAFGFLVGYGVPRVFLRTIQIAVPVLLAIHVARNARRTACAADEPSQAELS